MPDQHSYEDLIQRIAKLEEQNKNLKSEAIKYRTLFDSFPHGITVSDSHGNVIEANSISEQLLGINKKDHKKREISGREWRIIDKDGNDMPVNEWASVIALKENRLVTDCEMGIIKSDSQITWLNVTAAPIPLEGFGVVITYNDITEKKNAQKALRESEKRYRNIFKNKHVAMLVIDPKTGSIMDANPSATAFYGWSYHELTQMNIKEINTLPWDDLNNAMQKTKTEKGRLFHFQHRLKDGSIRDVEVASAPVEYGGKTNLFSIIHDITGRKEFEEVLRESEEKYRGIVENANEGIVITQNGMFKFINSKTSEISGYSQQELMSKPFIEIVYPDDRSMVMQHHIKRLKGEEIPGKYELRFVAKDGNVKWIENNGVIVGWEGNPATLNFITDITDRKQVEQALRESEERFRAIFESAQDFIFIKDSFLKYTHVNPAMEKLFQLKAQELFGKTDEELFGENAGGHIREVDSRVLAGEIVKEEHTKPVHETPITFNLIKVPLRDHLGKIVGLCGIAHDITERKQKEEALRKSHEMLKRTEAMANIGSWEWDVQHDQVNWSEELFRIFGRHPAEGEPPFAEQSEFYVNEDFQCLRDAVETCVKQGTSYEIEVRVIRIDGEIRHCVSRGEPQYDENGKVFQIFGSFQDITDRKQTEEVLKLNYELFHIAGETAKFGGWSVDLEKNICTWSDAVANIHDVPHGYAPPVQEAINFYAPEWREKITQCFSACAKDGIPYDEVMEIITQKGKRVWVRATGRSVKNENDKIIKVQGSFQDITEHKLAEEALKASEKKYQSLFQNAQVALFRNRLSDGKVLEINKRYAKMAGYSTIEECMAEFNAANAWVDPNGRKELLMILQENGFVSDYETEIIRKDGTNIWISFSATIFPEPGFLEGSIVEITERKRSEIEREKLQAQLIQAQKMESVGRLAGGVAHDFNNMLSVILGNAEIIMEDIDPSNPLVTNLEEIYKAAERSTNLTRQLLAFARKQTIDPKVLNLNHILDDMLKMLKRLIGEDIDLTWQPAQNRCFVKIDPSQIDQILANLCINARDAIKSVGKITIETDNSSFDEAYCKEHIGFNAGDYVMMAVSDNGSGMDKETLDNLFEPFFTTKNIGQGTGLGLATVYGIVKQNDGFINVYSEPGEGTTFKIYLPAYLETAVSKPKNLKKTSLTGNETILLVEDETAILRMTKMMLERLGYTVLTASAPKEAISIVEASNINTIHLLMTDVVMPEMNGRDLSKKLLRMYPGLKCLFMSGYTANVIAHHGVLDTGVQFINKPFSKQDLATKVREVLEEAKGEKF